MHLNFKSGRCSSPLAKRKAQRNGGYSVRSDGNGSVSARERERHSGTRKRGWLLKPLFNHLMNTPAGEKKKKNGIITSREQANIRRRHSKANLVRLISQQTLIRACYVHSARSGTRPFSNVQTVYYKNTQMLHWSWSHSIILALRCSNVFYMTFHVV